MSKPSFSNIDLWLFELSEGNLSAEQVAQLELFLLQHPEMDVDRDMWNVAKVDNDPVIFSQTESLMRRKPVAMYSAIGTTLFILLTFVGCYQYLDLDSLRGVEGNIAEGKSIGDREIQLLKEIESLKANVESLQTENENLTNSLSNETQLSLNQMLNLPQNAGGSNSNSTFVSQNSIASNNYRNSRGADVLMSQNLNGSINPSQNNSDTYYERINKAGKVERIRTTEPRTIKYDWYRNGQGFVRGDAKSAKFKKSDDRKISIKSRMKKVARSIQRMMDNPVALKNSRDPHYHVPGALPQDLNFGANGTLLTTRVQTMSRIQWLGEENEQMMNQLAIDGYSYGMRGGLGIQLNHSMYKNGGINVADVALTYSPKFSVSKWISVEPAIRFKMGNKMLNHEAMDGVSSIEMDRGNQMDYYQDGSSPIGKNLWYKDLGAGLMVNTKWFFAGVQVDNMFRHQDNIYTSDITSPRRAGKHFVATIGTDWESRKENMSLSPYAVYQNKENLSEAWLGMNYRWGWFNVGGAVSSNLEPAASIGLKFKRFAVNYNVDYTNSVMSGNKALSHQIGLKFTGKTSRFGQRLHNR